MLIKFYHEPRFKIYKEPLFFTTLAHMGHRFVLKSILLVLIIGFASAVVRPEQLALHLTPRDSVV